MLGGIHEKQILKETERFIRSFFEVDGSGHDWWHIHRVRNLSLTIAATEGGNLFVIEMAALLHDLDDWKLVSTGSENRTKGWLKKFDIPKSVSNQIFEVIEQVSFKGARVETKADSVEAKIVQDADRLDAIGAIGIARTFAYGGNKGRLLYDPAVKPQLHASFEAYKNNSGPTINHFYEKLLLLKDRLNTKTAGIIAEKRHEFMKEYLDHFFWEWEGKN